MRRRSRAAARRSEELRKAYPTEASLCDDFASRARSEGFTVHPETSQWDLLLVGGGVQVGVQAKLRAGVKVLAQALPAECHFDTLDCAGPDYRAVLVVDAVREFRRMARALGVIVFTPPELSVTRALGTAVLWDHTDPEWVPPCEVQGMGGGRSSPITISPWKIGAVRLCERLRQKGHLTRADFRELKISPTMWFRMRWLVTKRRGIYVAGEVPLPDQRWPQIVDAVRSMEGLPCGSVSGGSASS